MPIKANQLAEEPKLVASSATGPSTGSGRGSFFVLDIGAGQTEGAFTDESGNDIQLTDGGALNLANNTLANLSDVSSSAPSNGDVLTYNGSSWEPAAPTGGGGSGEANTASNLGAGEGVFSAKVGVDLRFKSLVAGTNVTLSSDANTVTINTTGGSSSGPQQVVIKLGGGATIADKVSNAPVGGIPAGYTIVDATDGSVDAQLSGSTDDLVIIHNQGQVGVDATVTREDTTFGGWLSTSFGNTAGDIKTESNNLNQTRLTGFNIDVGSTGGSRILFTLEG